MTKTQSKQKKILIVDNDPERKKIYNQVFNKNANITYQLVQSITKPSKILESKKFDMLITYLEFIDENKIDFLHKIKSENPKIYIILITEPINSKEIFRLNENGFDNYLFAPFSADNLTTIVRNIG